LLAYWDAKMNDLIEAIAAAEAQAVADNWGGISATAYYKAKLSEAAEDGDYLAMAAWAYVCHEDLSAQIAA